MKTILLRAVFIGSLFSGLFLGGQDRSSAAMAIQGEGPVETDTIKLDSFHSLTLGMSARVLLYPGDTQQVILRAQQNILENILKEVENGTWHIQFDKKVKSHDSILIEITLPGFRSLSVGGPGLLLGQGPFLLKDDVNLVLGGSGLIRLEGKAPAVRINLAGSGKMELEEFEVDMAHVSIAGSGEVHIAANQQLEVSIAGNGKVLYKGPAQVKSSIAGNGVVKRIN